MEPEGPNPVRKPLPWWRYTRWIWLVSQVAVVLAIVLVALWLVLAVLAWLFDISIDLLRLFSSPLGVIAVAVVAFAGGRASKR